MQRVYKSLARNLPQFSFLVCTRVHASSLNLLLLLFSIADCLMASSTFMSPAITAETGPSTKVFQLLQPATLCSQLGEFAFSLELEKTTLQFAQRESSCWVNGNPNDVNILILFCAKVQY